MITEHQLALEELSLNNREATIDALLATNNALQALLASVTGERNELKIMLRAARRAFNEGAKHDDVLKILRLDLLLGAPHVGNTR